VYTVFTARNSYASAVLGIVIMSVRLSVRLPLCPSVRPSVTRALCDKKKEHTAEIITSHERVINLVFWYQKRLVGDVPLNLKFALNVTHFVWKTPTSTNICLGSRPRAFQQAIDEVRTLPLAPPKGGSKSEFVVFVDKIQVQSNKVCYKVPLCENFNVVVEPFPYPSVYRCLSCKS